MVKPAYDDISDRIAESPKWWDENGTPRYVEFGTAHVADPYCDEAALLEIACQGCGRRFMVAMTSNRHLPHRADSVVADINARELHYGDPPDVGCCAAGYTMNSVPLRVVQYWSRMSVGAKWTRLMTCEQEVVPGWAKDWLREDAARRAAEPDTSDIPEQGAEFFKAAKLTVPSGKLLPLAVAGQTMGLRREPVVATPVYGSIRLEGMITLGDGRAFHLDGTRIFGAIYKVFCREIHGLIYEGLYDEEAITVALLRRIKEVDDARAKAEAHLRQRRGWPVVGGEPL